VKRHPHLRRLSDDHHTALVLARRLRDFPRTAEPAALAALAREVADILARELEPHFGVEERVLLPALRAAGEAGLAARTERDHTAVRARVGGTWHAATPGELGALLHDHVRFEERVLFPRAEQVLSAADLAAVAAAAER